MAVSLVLLAYRLVVLSPLCLNDHLMEWKSQRLMALNGLDERLKTYHHRAFISRGGGAVQFRRRGLGSRFWCSGRRSTGSDRRS